jgi:hypothetical protein
MPLPGSSGFVRDVAELAGRDHRWSEGSLCVGLTRLVTPEAATILGRARDALERGEQRGGGQVTVANQSR